MIINIKIFEKIIFIENIDYLHKINSFVIILRNISFHELVKKINCCYYTKDTCPKFYKVNTFNT